MSLLIALESLASTSYYIEISLLNYVSYQPFLLIQLIFAAGWNLGDA